jgi:hypothetical protein
LNILNVLSVQLQEHSGYSQVFDYHGQDEASRCQEWVDGPDLAVDIQCTFRRPCLIRIVPLTQEI